jgi:glycosyltransferase involved in cell wall biosynthesis
MVVASPARYVAAMSLDGQGMPPRVSVIVPVRNGRADVLTLLAALEAQTFGHDQFELVIGDDGSTDGSTSDLPPSSFHVTVASGPPRNSYAARNRAVRSSRAPVLAFCDADCRPEPEWLERGLAALPRADLVAGRIRFLLPSRRTVWTLLDMDGTKDHERQVENGTAETANLFLRRELFDRVGGFEEQIPEYGDFDFVQRAVADGATLAFAPDAVAWHPTRDRARPFFRALWIYNRGYGARESRAGRVPGGMRWKAWVPLVQPYLVRRGFGKSVGPDRKWLGENGVSPSVAETVAALPIMYLVVPYARGMAQLRGWFEGRRLRPPQGRPERA